MPFSLSLEILIMHLHLPVCLHSPSMFHATAETISTGFILCQLQGGLYFTPLHPLGRYDQNLVIFYLCTNHLCAGNQLSSAQWGHTVVWWDKWVSEREFWYNFVGGTVWSIWGGYRQFNRLYNRLYQLLCGKYCIPPGLYSVFPTTSHGLTLR